MSEDKLREIMKEWKIEEKNKKKVGNMISIQEKNNIGLTSFPSLLCQECEEEKEMEVETTKFRQRNYKGGWTTLPNCSWFQTNVETVLATLACGMGSTDTADFLSFLGIPKMHSFQHQQFTKIENLIGPYLRKVADRSMEEMLEEEIKATLMEKGMDYDEFKQDNNKQIGLTILYDMGWNKRSSGNRYDSISGHGFFVGSKTKKIICSRVASKKCKTCDLAEKRNETPGLHQCCKNHEGSSKSMEADSALKLLTDLHHNSHGKVHLKFIVSDDDSSMKSLLRHNTPTTRKGQLPNNIPEPSWLANPGHRTKVVSKPMFKFVNTSKYCTKVDTFRFKNIIHIC